MKQKMIPLSQLYVAALRDHVKRGARAVPWCGTALELGRQAVALGLETLDLARIHDWALAALGLSGSKNGVRKRAGIFFSAANVPIEETHRAARQGKINLSRLNKTLDRRTEALAASNRQVRRGVVRRKVMEEDFAKSGRDHHKSLEESLQLQKLLRQLTRQALVAQEDDRTKISHELQDEIAQTLIGINVRLLSLKQGAGGNIQALKNEIASTQRMVVKSAKAMRRFARELGTHQPTLSGQTLAEV